MIDEYKKFLKENSQEFFAFSTAGVGVLLFFFILYGGIHALSGLDRFTRNSKEMGFYMITLATFQKCAEKVTDASLVETYCGSAPREPALSW